MQDFPISKELLTDFMSGFYGYGNLNSPYWFIGKEEGGGKEMEENYRRVKLWEGFGKPLTVDINDYHLALGFTEKKLNNIQSTWTKLVQILLAIKNVEDNIENRRKYQRQSLGISKGDNCELELMPLAARSTGGTWKWGEIFNSFYGISQRKHYFEQVSQERIYKIKELISRYQPKLVVMYSSDKEYVEKWSQIADAANWHWVKLSSVMRYGWYVKDNRVYVITTHPTTPGITSNDYREVGTFISGKLPEIN